MKKSAANDSPKAALFLPDGTGTEPQAGDVLVWEKDTGKMYIQRPGIGLLKSPIFDENPMATDEESVREFEREIKVGLGWSGMEINIRLADESEKRAVFEFTGTDAAS